MIKSITYPISNLIITNELLVIYINKFWGELFNSIKDTHHLMLICKVHFSDENGEETSGYRTLGHLRKVNFGDKDLFIDYLIQRLGILNDSYMSQPISNITFSYIIKDGQCTDTNRALLNLEEKVDSNHRFNNMNLPISMNPEDYGDIEVSSVIEVNGESIQRYIVNNGSKIFRIDVNKKTLTNKVTILGNITLTWIDTKLEAGINFFKREIKKSTIYFLEGEIVLRKQLIPAKPFKSLVPDSIIQNNFYTLDIETIKIDSKLEPYLICAFDGTEYITSFNKNQITLFKTFFDQLLTKIKGGTTIIYAHNLSSFDGIFLMKNLITYGAKVNPLLFNGKLISIKAKFIGKNKSETKTIVFKDSYLLLPLSLRKLCVAFNVLSPKGFFPFKLVDILYKGVFPKFEYFTGVSLNEYNELVKSFTGKSWSFRDEAIKYCKLDCKCLHEVLLKFNELIFNEFKINIHSVLTLPSLAMRIYKTHFMPENSIYQLLGSIERNIRESYTGGAVDMYIPHNRIGSFISGFFKKLFCYDVNGLYPFIMAKTLMPIGKPIYFEGNIREYNSNAFGFFYCKITSPNDLQHPILQRRIKTSDGLRTVAGLGSWQGWIFSTEMDNAARFKYQFEILKGYEFEKGNIFEDFVITLYNLRLQFDKTDAMNLIAKLLMNNLYGKFGMNMETTKVEIFNTSNEVEFKTCQDMVDVWKESIKSFIKLDNYLVIVRNSLIDLYHNDENDIYHGLDINVAIASAVTAGARCWMSLLKNNPNFKLYYSDTDSGVTDRPLPPHMVGPNLGQFKLEHVIERAVFLAPKVYGLITEDGQQIIKVKGITSDVTSQIDINDLEALLVQDSNKEFIQEKWFKNVIEGNIRVTDQAYNLKVTSNKRSLIYVNNILENTKPYYYDEIINKTNK